MAKRIKIRRATAYDVVDLTRLLERGVEEQQENIWYPSLSVDPMKRVSHVLAMIDKGYVVVADMLVVVGDQATGQRGLVGAIGLAITQDQWSDDWMLASEWTYILPEYRDGKMYDNMMTMVEHWADTQISPDTGLGLPIMLSNMSGMDTDVKDKLIERRGYQYGGGNFVRAPYHEQETKDGLENGDPEVARVG